MFLIIFFKIKLTLNFINIKNKLIIIAFYYILNLKFSQKKFLSF